MSDAIWNDLHKNYSQQDWVDKPSIFAETAITHFPKTGRVLDLGAGLGQDSRFFAEQGYDVVSTDLKATALAESKAKGRQNVTFQELDLRELLPFDDASFDVVYAHLSLHYFDQKTTERIFQDIHRVLKPGGVFAFFVNSVDDPENNTGEKIEDNFFHILGKPKRFMSVEDAGSFAAAFTPRLLDNKGETYKDRAKGVHNLVRFIGIKE